MAQDYARRRQPAKKPRPRNAPPSKLPHWVWFLSGFASGFFAAFLVYLLKLGPALEKQASELTEQAATESGVPVEEKSDGKHTSPRFEFYNLLPKIEIDTGTDTNKPVDRKLSKAGATRYLLQCGSFRRIEDAEARRTELLLMDLPASIQTVALKSGEKTHRVVAGPYDNINAMNRAQDVLSMNGIDSLTIRLDP